MDEDKNSEPQIEAPLGLLPDLSLWGIVEVDRGVCEDSFENRRLIRENGARWTDVFTSDGRPTNLLQVVTEEMRQARIMQNKSILLTDQRNPDADYKTGLHLLLNLEADNTIPAWVVAATRHWINVEEERERRGPEGKPYRPAITGPPARCLARTLSGHRCSNWANGTKEMNGLCKMHLANHHTDTETPGVNTLAKARNRIISGAVAAAEGLEELATSSTVSEVVRLNAIKEMLDRAGIRGGVEVTNKVEINVDSASRIVMERLKKLSQAENTRQAIEAMRHEDEPEVIEVEYEEITVKKKDRADD